MRIGIDISQIVYEGTGVARYVRNLVAALIKEDTKNEYVLFGATLRKRGILTDFADGIRKYNNRVTLRCVPIPPIILDLIWNRLHILPVEIFTGRLDVFWSSDWTQPPLTQAAGVTTVFDIVYLKYPRESHPQTGFSLAGFNLSPNIVATQKRRMGWAVRECRRIFCDSVATKNDLVKYVGINPEKLTVIYPGINV
jgi:hypothetical protein